jgi:hypothetical protein
LAQCLQATYGIKHFLLEPPQKVIVITAALENFNLYEGGLTNRIPTQSRHRSGSFATVQRVQLAPTPLLVIRAMRKSPKMWDKFDMFYKTQVEDKSLFVNTLKSDIESALDCFDETRKSVLTIVSFTDAARRDIAMLVVVEKAVREGEGKVEK